MKKTLILFVAVAMLAFITACNKPQDVGVSQLRTDILTATSGDYTASVYVEEREIPLVADGTACARTPVIIVKITSLHEISGTYSIFTTVGERDYSAQPTQRTANTLRAEIVVDSLPDKELSLTLKGSDEVTFSVRSILPEGTANYQKALATAKSALGTKIEYEDGKPKGEFFVRVLVENGNAFWYVGYVTDQGTRSLLISADGGSVIATHDSAA